MKLAEFTYNKNRILIDADNVQTVIAAKPREFYRPGMSRQEYWSAYADTLVYKATCLVFKNAAGASNQYVDQTIDEAFDILSKATGSAINREVLTKDQNTQPVAKVNISHKL